MKITLAVVGKIKEKYWNLAIDEYSKRLSRYASLSICQIADEPTPDHASQLQEVQIRHREGERLLKELSKYDRSSDVRVIALAIDGKAYDSVSFSKHLDELQVGGFSHLIFVIGGSLGLSEAVLKRADEKISFSAMTFPHQMMRVILLEQIYRAQRISRNEPYHK
jgi:23S rRNA (pseudouridine1915-N3)-methyltransferase